MESRKIKFSVIGVGHLGRAHARVLTELPNTELVSVVDIDEERGTKEAERLGVPWERDFKRTPGNPEAVCVVVPTFLHFQVASWFLQRNVHVLVEKPITSTIEEAEILVKLARERDLVLQVGHVERFNPIFTAVKELGIKPRYLEAQRVAPFTFRSMDVGVVMDLMIHDLDLVLTLVDGDPIDVEAYGGKVFTDKEDLASARIKFSSGDVAHLTVSRVALRPARRLRLFSKDSYVSLDFGKRYGILIKKGPRWEQDKPDLKKIDPSKIEDLWKFVYTGLLTVKEIRTQGSEPLKEELASFASCIIERKEPVVTGLQGKKALELAFQVEEALNRHPW